MSATIAPGAAAAATAGTVSATPRSLAVLIFGCTGMIGQSVLRQALLHPRVTRITTVGRSPSPLQHAKLTQLTIPDLSDLTPLKAQLSGFDAAFWCVGVTSAGLDEAAYTAVTHDLTLHAAHTLLPLNPALTFIFVSAQLADSTATSRTMWARVKGRTENEILALPFPRSSYVFRPGVVIPLNGIESRTSSYRWGYRVLSPLLWALGKLSPQSQTDTTVMGEAMIRVAERGYSKRILETLDVRQVGMEAAAEAAAEQPHKTEKDGL